MSQGSYVAPRALLGPETRAGADGRAGASGDSRTGLGKALSHFSAYGWRGRIGLIAPSTNTTIEPEFAMAAPEGVSVHVSRVPQSGGQAFDSYRRMAEGLATAADLLSTAEIDVIVFGCTSCTYFVPPDEVTAAMRHACARKPILVEDAVLEALGQVGARRVALLTPRTAFVTEREVETLERAGFLVSGVRGLGLGVDEEERRAIGRVPPESLFRMAAELAEDADAVFVSCTQLPTFTILDRLERTLAKPVVTSNQAALWACLRRIGVKDPIRGFGALLERTGAGAHAMEPA